MFFLSVFPILLFADDVTISCNYVWCLCCFAVQHGGQKPSVIRVSRLGVYSYAHMCVFTCVCMHVMYVSPSINHTMMAKAELYETYIVPPPVTANPTKSDMFLPCSLQ